MNGPSLDEFRVLRETIARRGTLRPALFLAGMVAWALVLVGVLAWLPYPLAALIPLLTLVATFEAIRPLHFGAERIGRYLQVFYEEAGAGRPMSEPPAWERAAMAFGSSIPGAGGHPLFMPLFGLATFVNFVAVLLPAHEAMELWSLAVPHAAFLVWLVTIDRAVRAQRPAELARFRALRDK